MHSLCYYPTVDSQAMLIDIISRAAWFLPDCPLSEITIPVDSEAIRTATWHVAPGMDPAIADRFDRIRPLVNLVTIDSIATLQGFVSAADIVLKWSEQTPDISVPKDLLSSKKVWRVDPRSNRMEGSIYIEVSLHLLADKARLIEANKSRFAQLSDRLGNFENAYVLATGPSVSNYAQFDYSNSLAIVCNSVICDEALMDAVKPQILVFADPIFHFGPSQYAAAFRQHLRKAAGKYDFTIFIPFKYQAIFSSTMPDLVNRMLAVPFTKERGFNFDLRADYEVRTTANILTLLLLPLATTFSNRVGFLGCDGRPLAENNYFWNHNQKTQINDKMANIREVHPAFFAIDYNDYYVEHCETLENLLCAGEVAGKKFTSLAFSHIPALQKRMSPQMHHPAWRKGFQGRLIIIDPDALDWSGHYMAYNEKLSAQLEADGCKVTVLCRKDLDPSIISARPDYHPCFSRFSWQIGNPQASQKHADTFQVELFQALNEVARRRILAGEGTEPLLIYMYCGGVEHAEILKAQADRIGANVHVNLFYLSFRMTDEYAHRHRPFFERLQKESASGSFIATVPTPQLGKRLGKMIGCELPYALHPSTGVSDLKFQSLRAEYASRFNSAKPLTVLFPSAPRLEKGYSDSCEAARILCSGASPLRCILKHAPNATTPADLKHQVRKVEGMEVIEGALENEDFLRLFTRSQIVVLPYTPDAFSERTSGLLIDALYFGLPCVVIRGTWLSDIVEEYGCGVSIDRLSASLLAEGVRTVVNNYEHYRQRALCAGESYFKTNSWRAFSEFVRSCGSRRPYPTSFCTLKIQENSVKDPTATHSSTPVVLAPNSFAQVNKPEASQSFSFVSPNCWTFTKSLNSDKQKQLIFPANPPCYTKGREFLAVAILEMNVYSEVEVSLGRHGTTTYEGSSTNLRLGAGQSTPVLISHTFAANHERIKFQIKIHSCAADTMEITVRDQFLFPVSDSKESLLEKGGDVFSLANSAFRDGRYLESAILYLHLAHQKPNIPFYQEMAKSALESAGIQSVILWEKILEHFL